VGWDGMNPGLSDPVGLTWAMTVSKSLAPQMPKAPNGVGRRMKK
jgi:hypothetical protein